MHLLDLLFPRRCVSCEKVGKYFCEICYQKIEFVHDSFCVVCKKPAMDGMTHPRCRTTICLDGIFAAVRYQGPVKNAVHQFKYRFVKDLSATLSEIIIKNYPAFFPKFAFYLPVPLYKTREKERGFNQSLLLAQNLSKAFNIPVMQGVLRKIRPTKPQADLNSKERRENMKNAFVYSGKVNLHGKTIGLVDDVSTTGTTLLECAKILKKNGAKSVWGIVLAHG